MKHIKRSNLAVANLTNLRFPFYLKWIHWFTFAAKWYGMHSFTKQINWAFANIAVHHFLKEKFIQMSHFLFKSNVLKYFLKLIKTFFMIVGVVRQNKVVIPDFVAAVDAAFV